MRWTSLLLVAVLGLALTSCDHTLSEPQETAAEAAPTFNFANNPDAGPRILRWEDAWGQWIPLDFADMTLVIGFDPALECAGIYDYDTWAVQDGFFRNNWDRFNELWVGNDIRTSLWPGVMWDFDCEFFEGNTPIGSGMSKVRGTYNDFFGDLYEHNHATKWGGIVKAKLYSPAGEMMNFIYQGTCVWNGHHVDGKCNDRVNLTP